MSFPVDISWSIVYSAALGSGIIGLVFKLIEKLVDHKLEDDKVSKARKRGIIEEAMEIISEAESTNFKEPPRDNGHVIHISNKLRAVDKRLAALFDGMKIKWELAQVVREKTANAWDWVNMTGDGEHSKKEQFAAKAELDKLSTKLERVEKDALVSLSLAKQRASKLL